MSPETMAKIDGLTVSLGDGFGPTALNIVLALVMFGIALDIKPKTFFDVFKNPKAALVGLLSQFILLPALTFCLAILLKGWISPMMGLGMILVAACPGGNISNFITSLAKGNTAIAVTLTGATTGLAVFATPFNFSLWGNLYIRFLEKRSILQVPDLQIPLMDVFVTIVIILGIPVVLGMLCNQFLPKVADRLKKPLKTLSTIFFLALVVIIFLNNWKVFIQCIQYIFLIVLVHNALAFTTGFYTARAFRLSFKDSKTISIETGIQNSGLGLVLLLNPNIFDPVIWANNGGMLVITAWWGVWHIVAGLLIAYLFLKLGPKHEYENISRRPII